MKQTAKRLAAQGRHGDTELMHLNKQEVRTLHGVAALAGRKLTKNPKTGLDEAFNLFDILPFALNFIFPGMGTVAQIGLGALSGAASSAVEGNDPLTGALTGGVLSGLGGSLFGGGADAAGNAAVQAANQGGNAAQAAFGGGDVAKAAATALNQTVAAPAPYLTDLAGAGSDQAVGDFFGRLTSKQNLPYTLAGGAALASLLPAGGLDLPSPGDSGKGKLPIPAKPRAYHTPPADYLPGYDPEWSYFSPNPNYPAFGGGGPVADAMNEELNPRRTIPRRTINTNEPDSSFDRYGDVDVQRILRDIDARQRRLVNPTAAESRLDRIEADDRARLLQQIDDTIAGSQRTIDDARASGIYGLGEGVNAPVLARQYTGHIWDQGRDTPMEGGAWSNGPQIMSESMPTEAGPVVRIPVQMPQFLPGRQEAPWQPAPEPNLGDAEAYYQDKINAMYRHHKKLSQADREKYDYYVNMRDVERSKKTGKRINPRFDPNRLNTSGFARGGLAGFRGRDDMAMPAPTSAWWRGDGNAPQPPAGPADPMIPGLGFFGTDMRLSTAIKHGLARPEASMAAPTSAWWRGEGSAPQAVAQVQGKTGPLGAMSQLGMLNLRGRGVQTPATPQAPVAPVYTPRPPDSLIANNTITAAPSITPTLFQPVTPQPVQGMAGGGMPQVPMPRPKPTDYPRTLADIIGEFHGGKDRNDYAKELEGEISDKSTGVAILKTKRVLFGGDPRASSNAVTDEELAAAVARLQEKQSDLDQIKSTVAGYASGGLASMASPKMAMLQQLMGRHIQGAGQGMADDVPAMIDGREPAALSSGEVVVPADVVAHLGDGNSEAGAKILMGLVGDIRKLKTGKRQQPAQLKELLLERTRRAAQS